MALTDKLTAIGNAIRNKTGKSELLTLDQMSIEIAGIETGGGSDLPEEAFTITGNCNYRFAYGGWDWFIEKYGNKVKTKDIDNAQRMFHQSLFKNVPFELNFKDTSLGYSLTNLFMLCSNLESVPKINNCKVTDMDALFSGCNNLRNVPEDMGDWFDWSIMEAQTSGYSGAKQNMFQNCYSLRSVPISLLTRCNKNVVNSYSYFYGGFSSCYVLDELTDLPMPYIAAWTSNVFSSTFNDCYRIKNITFAMPNGQPCIAKWKSQTINLTTVGYVKSNSSINIGKITNNNSGITVDKEVSDDASYQALKNDPDWFATNVAYSRYNHDGAVATINSLPDTSAYLATAGGTNTIKFTGAAGSATDGGAINTLTEEEIAVATAKGWTVTLA